MFSPKTDMRELILEVLGKDPASISGIARELEGKGVKLHRLELTGYLKALADMGTLKEKEIKPAKVFSISPSKDKSFHELLGEACSSATSSPDEAATLYAYILQKVFRRAVFDMEVQRSGLDGIVAGRKATNEERSDAKSVLVRLGYKVPNSDVPTIVEGDMDLKMTKALSYVLIERYSLGQFIKETTQAKL